VRFGFLSFKRLATDLESISLAQNQPSRADLNISTNNSLPQTESALSVAILPLDIRIDDFNPSIEDSIVNFYASLPFTYRSVSKLHPKLRWARFVEIADTVERAVERLYY
jgi:hypothetical protein